MVQWYTDVKAWKIELAGAATFSNSEPLPEGEMSDKVEDDLPF